ncbi:germination protein, Ger(x)C family [Cohnella sp. OV330]|uniref:Ger(x)C family spore germination protein n=1 Tax=Cohnella sp. OV330 TaxID=1855288 RepID=UPI0008E54626|nr:Ger(x)C family spore germination protein [Cohnella sp. OV330]SFB52626.1 germination protein, Ger(x)C family [Cohnella sp. OV330]
MKRIVHALGISLLSLGPLTGCFDRVDLEDASLSLVAGVDITEDHRTMSYTSIPVFSKAEKKSQELKVVANTQREGRGKLDAFTVGTFNGRKIKVIALSKRFVQETPDWFRYMDIYFRDGRNPITPRVVVFDGTLDQLFYYHSPNQPILPLMLMGMIKSASERSETVDTTLQELHRQMNEEGQTPFLTEMSIKQDAMIDGTSLLDHKGRYVDMLSMPETVLLRILQKNARQSVGFSLRMPSSLTGSTANEDWVSIATERVKVKIDSAYAGGRFRFFVNLRFSASVVEKLSGLDLDDHQGGAEAACAEELRDKFEALIAKLQRKKVDPVGFGIYARAHHYKRFKQVKENWGEAFGQSEVKVRVSVGFADEGSVK